eukprot:3376620-Prymnesium_polylepis.1
MAWYCGRCASPPRGAPGRLALSMADIFTVVPRTVRDWVCDARPLPFRPESNSGRGDLGGKLAGHCSACAASPD